MMTIDLPSFVRHLGFSIFFSKSLEITEINPEESHDAYEMYKFNMIKKTGKTIELSHKKLIYGQT